MNTIEYIYNIYLKYLKIQTDTRKLKKGDIFFALKGNNFNGNEFALTALQNGASFCIVDEIINTNNPKIILVNNVLECLQELAAFHRKKLNIPVIAITGSNGKTTTKELIYKVLKNKYKTSATEGNLNNHIGIPLTILKIPLDCEIAIIEMGANHQKEIESYCKYTLPNFGIITNCGKAHIGYFGGEEGVKKAKGELFDFLKTNKNSSVFINSDDNFLIEKSKEIKNIYTYGKNNNYVCGEEIESNPFLKLKIKYKNEKIDIQSNLVGSYNLPNILCAVAVGVYFKIDLINIKNSIENYNPTNSRSQWLEKDDNFIILDAYNANPNSMELAIYNFCNIKSQKQKIIFLGEMKELGNDSLEEHQKIIDILEKHIWENVILIGKDFLLTKNNYLCFEDIEKAILWYKDNKYKNSLFLIKGSRASKMEKILEII